MEKIYYMISEAKHNAQKVRDFSSGNVRALGRRIVELLDRIVERLEVFENEKKLP